MPFIKTALVITDCQPIEKSEDGYRTLGQLLDDRVSSHLQQWREGAREARLQSLEIGWETDEEWHAFAREACESGAYPARNQFGEPVEPKAKRVR